MGRREIRRDRVDDEGREGWMKSSRDKKMQGVNRLSGRRGVQKSLLCDPGSELRRKGREERRAGTTQRGMKK